MQRAALWEPLNRGGLLGSFLLNDIKSENSSEMWQLHQVLGTPGSTLPSALLSLWVRPMSSESKIAKKKLHSTQQEGGRVKGKSLTWRFLLDCQWQETHHIVIWFVREIGECIHLVGHIIIPNKIEVPLAKQNGGHRIGNCVFLPQEFLLNKTRTAAH